MTTDARLGSPKPRRFFGLLCRHEWEILRTYRTVAHPWGCAAPRDIGNSYDMRCKHCGWIRMIEP